MSRDKARHSRTGHSNRSEHSGRSRRQLRADSRTQAPTHGQLPVSQETRTDAHDQAPAHASAWEQVGASGQARANTRPKAPARDKAQATRTDDASYKLLFSSPQVVRDLVLGFIPDEWLQGLDYSTLEKVPGSYVTDDLRHRADDVVWRVRSAEDWVYLYLLIEFQSRPDPWMAVRMMTYVGLLYQDLIRRGELPPAHEAADSAAPVDTVLSADTSTRPGAATRHSLDDPQASVDQQRRPVDEIHTGGQHPQPGTTDTAGPKARRLLPPVLPIVLYNGSARWRAATDIAQLLPKVPGVVAKYLPRMQYLLLDQNVLACQPELARMENLAAAMMRVEYPENEQALIALIDELNEWLDGQPELKRTFAIWIRAVLLRRHDKAWALPKVNDLKELKMGLTRQIDQWAEVHRQEGLRQGMQQGRQEGRLEGRTEGRQEGRLEGHAEGRREGRTEGAQQAQTLILQRLLTRRFGELPPLALQRIREAQPAQLEAWIDRILDADSLTAVFADS